MFHFNKTQIPDLLTITCEPHQDVRGFFCETYRTSDFQQNGIPPFVQENHSKSDRGTIRGLHFQTAPHAQGKLVRCVRGSILDVAVDLRPNSKTFGQHYSKRLVDYDFEYLWIPAGFAHGFLALEDKTEIQYKTTAYYSKEHERSIKFDDPELKIDWYYTGIQFFNLSIKDQQAPSLKEACRENFGFEDLVPCYLK